MWTYNESPILCHYGVLGMKWGKRNSYKNKINSTTNHSKVSEKFKNAKASNNRISEIKSENKQRIKKTKSENKQRTKEAKQNYKNKRDDYYKELNI